MEDEAFESAETGSSYAKNSSDIIIANAKPDIIIKIGWIKNTVGFNYSLSYRLEALDSYSNKSIAAVTSERRPRAPHNSPECGYHRGYEEQYGRILHPAHEPFCRCAD